MKFYYQCVAISLSMLFNAMNHAQKSVMASSKLWQEREESLHITKDFLSKADVVFMIGQTFGSYQFGKIIDKYDIRKFLFIYSFVESSVFAFIAFITDEWFLKIIGNYQQFENVLLFVIFVYGVLFCSCYPACASLFLNWTDEDKRGRIASVWSAAANFGGIFTFYMCYYITNIKGLKWRNCYYAQAILFQILGLITFFILEPYPQKIGIHIKQSEEQEKMKNIQQVEQNEMSESKKLVQLFKINYVQMMVLIYTICINSVSVLDLWLYPYYQNQGLFISAHKLSELYELFSFFGGIFLGTILDKNLKKWKITTICVMFILTSLMFNILYCNFSKSIQFIIIPMIGFTLGGNYNYLVLIAAKLLLDHPKVGKIGIKTATLVGILETFSNAYVIINFYNIPQNLDFIFLILGFQAAFAAIVCFKEVYNEYKKNKLIQMEHKLNEEEDIQLLKN